MTGGRATGKVSDGTSRSFPARRRHGLAGHAFALAADIIYIPLETPFLAAARGRGNRTVNGLGMLLHQGRPAWKAWFGIEPEVTPELRAMVEQTT